jgi:glycosyltransferase involved in cell wall biosynthesis
MEYFREKYDIINGNVIMNFPNYKSVKPNKKIDYREMFNCEDSAKIILYQGALNEGRGLRLIINSMSFLSDKFCLVIIGEGPIKKELIENTKLLNLQHKIKFLDFVELNNLPEYTMAADMGINLLEDYNLSKKMASPNKLFEYIHAGLPVISTNTIENKKVLVIHPFAKTIEIEKRRAIMLRYINFIDTKIY